MKNTDKLSTFYGLSIEDGKRVIKNYTVENDYFDNGLKSWWVGSNTFDTLSDAKIAYDTKCNVDGVRKGAVRLISNKINKVLAVNT
jgi:hypothetical protein